MKLPFMGKMSIEIKCKIDGFLITSFPQFKLIFSSENKIRNYFKFKNKLSLPSYSWGVFKYKCDGCDATYIGKTVRNLSTFTAEHKGISIRTLDHLHHSPYWAINVHSLQANHRIQDTNFWILAQLKNLIFSCWNACIFGISNRT